MKCLKRLYRNMLTPIVFWHFYYNWSQIIFYCKLCFNKTYQKVLFLFIWMVNLEKYIITLTTNINEPYLIFETKLILLLKQK